MTRRHLSIALTCLAVVLGGCNAQTGSAAYGALKPRQAVDARSAMPADEAVLVREVALMAHDALADTDDAYKALALDTAHGRKLTPARETLVRSGLQPVVSRLDDVAAAISRRLATLDTSRMGDLRLEFNQRTPQAEQVLAADAGANDMLYRVAQYRLKLSFLLEYALRKGALPNLPGKRSAPSISPTPGA